MATGFWVREPRDHISAVNRRQSAEQEVKQKLRLGELEERPDYNHWNFTPVTLSPARLYLLNVPWPPQTAPSAGDLVFEDMKLQLHFSFESQDLTSWPLCKRWPYNTGHSFCVFLLNCSLYNLFLKLLTFLDCALIPPFHFPVRSGDNFTRVCIFSHSQMRVFTTMRYTAISSLVA